MMDGPVNPLDILLLASARADAFLVAAIGALALGAACVPALRRLKVGQPVRDDGPASHLKKAGTPTMGGVIILLPAVAAVAALAAVNPALRSALPAAVAALCFSFVGFIDDFLKIKRKSKDGLSPSYKTIGLVIVSLGYTAYLVFIARAGTDMLLPLGGMRAAVTIPVWLYVPFNVFVFNAAANGVNLTDGVDGLASSVTLVVMVAFALAASLRVQDAGAMALAAALAGGCLGFLAFNLHPARVFMGDVGSYGLGGAVAAIAVMLRAHWVILLFGGVYVVESLSVIIQVSHYKRTKRRVFKMAPIHHHFEVSGWREGAIVATWVGATIIGCALGLALLIM
jgi:phospho-N-acetylmuramoyl-pentapeptide-transferase